MNDINLTVGRLKEILNNEAVSDDMDVIIPVISEDNANYIFGFRHVRTAGIVECAYEEHKALILNSSENGADISTQIREFNGDTSCNKVLY